MTKKNKIFKKVFQINYAFFPFFSLIAIVLILLEAVTYKGFIASQIFLSPEIIFVLFVFSAFLSVMGYRHYIKTTYFRLLAKLTFMFFPALFVVGLIFLIIEAKNHPGYVYTHGFHFNPMYFLYLFAIFILIFFADAFTNSDIFHKYKPTQIPNMFLSISIIILFVFMLITNLFEDIYEVRPELAAVIKHPFADDDYKNRYLFADFYDYSKFIKKHTPDDAVFLRMVQQSKWPAVSNDGYVRRFIYPRHTLAGGEGELSDPRITHVFIHRAYGPPRVNKYIEKWPDFPVKAEKVIYMKEEGYKSEPIVIDGDYNPNDHTYDDYWGIIFLKK